MLGSHQHRDMTCGWHARMPIRRLMLLASLSAEGSVPSDVLAGFKRAESASTNCISTFNAIECRTHVKPSLPLRGTCWLPWHLPLSNHGVRPSPCETVRSVHGSGWRLCDLFLLWIFGVLRCCVVQSGGEPGLCQPCRVVPSVRVGASALTLAPEPPPDATLRNRAT